MSDKPTKEYKLLTSHYITVDKKLTKLEKGDTIKLTPKQARSLVNKVEAVEEPKPKKKATS